MGLMDEIEAASAIGTTREPTGPRLRRRVGAGITALGMVLTLVAVWATSWHVMDFHGFESARVKIGLWKAEVCAKKSGDCVPYPRVEVVELASDLSTSSEGDINAWLDRRWQVGAAMITAALAAAVLASFGLPASRRRRTRRVAIVAGGIGVVTAILVLRSMFAAPVALMGHGTAATFALAGIFDLLLGAVLIGIGRDRSEPVLPGAPATGGAL